MQRDNISYLSLFEFRFGLTEIVKKGSKTCCPRSANSIQNLIIYSGLFLFIFL